MLKLVDNIFKTTDAKRTKKPFERNGGIEYDYAQQLVEVAKRIEDLMAAYNPADTNTTSKVIAALQQYSRKLDRWANKAVSKIVYRLNEDDERKWNAHAEMMTRELRYEINHAPIDGLMRQYLADNVDLIQSLPLEAAIKIQRLALKNLYTGKQRAEGLADAIQKIGQMTRSRAMLIARTEVSRVTTGLTKARAEELDLNWYVWRTSRDVRVRHSHSIMDNVLVKWSDPASPERLNGDKRVYGYYNPGEIFNCRCFAQPLIDMNDIQWPHKVYMNGSIRSMSKTAFMKLNNIELEKAA